MTNGPVVSSTASTHAHGHQTAKWPMLLNLKSAKTFIHICAVCTDPFNIEMKQNATTSATNKISQLFVRISPLFVTRKYTVHDEFSQKLLAYAQSTSLAQTWHIEINISGKLKKITRLCRLAQNLAKGLKMYVIFRCKLHPTQHDHPNAVTSITWWETRRHSFCFLSVHNVSKFSWSHCP